MTYFLTCIIPLTFLLTFLLASIKKVKIYDSFSQGVKKAVPLILSVFPYVVTVSMLWKLLDVSGLGNLLSTWLRPFFQFLQVPEEIYPLLLIKPFSGGGSIAVLTEILERYGVDSYISRCACVVYGASDTIFYISAVYFMGVQRKKLSTAILIALVSYALSIVFACFLCRIM